MTEIPLEPAPSSRAKRSDPARNGPARYPIYGPPMQKNPCKKFQSMAHLQHWILSAEPAMSPKSKRGGDGRSNRARMWGVMKRLLLGTSAIAALAVAQPSRAADLSSPPPPKSLTAASTNWTGCYAGASAGVGVTSDSVVGDSGGGGLIGGQLGCNVQTGVIVFGLEGEAAWSGLSNSNIFTQAGFSSQTADRSRWNADLSVRAGVAVDRALVYGKVGLATGGFASAFSDTNGDFQNASGTLSGPLLGFGVEVAFAPNWSARLEYNHIDYVGKTLHFDQSAANGGPFDQSTSAQTDIVKAGINYRFGGADFALTSDQPTWSPIAKAPAYKASTTAAYDWTGCYLGASAGAGVLSDSRTDVNGANGLGGGQLGCNLQTGQIVFGVEGEAISGLKDRSDSSSAFGSTEITGRNRWSADLAARAGVAIDRALVYGKVGAASGGFAFARNDTSGGFQNASGTLTGIVFGFGVEYAFAPHWSARLE